MKKLIEVQGGSEQVLIEVAEEPAGVGPQGFSTGGEHIERLGTSMDESLGVLSSIGQSLRRSLADVGASEAEATLAIKFSASGKLIVAQASAEATMTVKLKFVA
jgi:hypothetical protein